MFEDRLTQAELIDEPDCRSETIRRSHAFMRFVNRYFGGTSAVKNFIRCAARTHGPDRPLHILDIGSGSCDIPLSLLKWARRRHLDITFTCIEKTAAALPSGADFQNLPIRFVHSDIFDYVPDRVFDCAVASMFLHHLSHKQIDQLVRRLAPCIRSGIFINDLHRTAWTYGCCLAISPFLPGDVRHDALTSIRKGFRRDDFGKVQALSEHRVSVAVRPWGRITAWIELKGEN